MKIRNSETVFSGVEEAHIRSIEALQHAIGVSHCESHRSISVNEGDGKHCYIGFDSRFEQQQEILKSRCMPSPCQPMVIFSLNLVLE